jgi:large conductance mechanosensitive channel
MVLVEIGTEGHRCNTLAIECKCGTFCPLGNNKGCKAMFSEFKAFINKGNVLDLAVGVLIGAAFGKIIESFTGDILMPFIGLLTGGGVDFSSKFTVLGGDGTSFVSLDAARAAGANVFAYGSFITALINFLILAFVIFMIVRQANKMLKRADDAGTPEDIMLLREISASLKK